MPIPLLPLPAELSDDGADEEFSFAQPGATQIRRSKAAFEELASEFATAAARVKDERQIDVLVGHVDHAGYLSSRLHVISSLPVVDQRPVSPFEINAPVRYLVPLNISVALQRQSVLSSISRLIVRQSNLEKVQDSNFDVSRLDQQSLEWDAAAQNQLVDVLRYGWKAAIASIAREAKARGIVLNFCYEPTPYADMTDIAQKIPAFVRAYNEVSLVRELLDRCVFTISGAMRLVASAYLPDVVVDGSRELLTLGRMRQSLAQAIRDALVTGNGYVAFSDFEPLSTYNIDPADGREANSKQVVDPHGVIVPGVHMTGMRQIESPYGLSLLEPILQHLQSRDIYQSVRARIEDLEPDQRERAERTIGPAAEMLKDAGRSFESQLRIIYERFQSLPEAPPNLYFPGHARMGSRNGKT